MKRFFGLVVLLATAAGCGGGSTATGLRVTPEEARPSDRVVLSGAGLEVDDTVCFVPLDESGDAASKGCPHPVMPEASTANEKEFQATIEVPTGLKPGAYVIKVARGSEIGDGVDFTVLSFEQASEKTPKSAENGTTPSGSEGETILPSGGSADDPSVYEDYADSGGTLPPPPVPAVLSASLEGTKAVPEASLGTVRIDYATTGSLKNFYIYGPFTSDTDCDDKLAIDPSGNDLNPGSPNAVKYADVLSGQVCDAAAGNCRGFEAPAGTPTHCRIDLSSTTGTFYARMYQKDVVYRLVAEGEDGTFEVSEKTLSAPQPSVNPQIRILTGSPYVVVGFNFAHAIADPSFTMAGDCATDPSLPKSVIRNQDGSGSFTQHCRLSKNEMTIALSVPGIGAVAGRTVTVKLDRPTATLNAGAVTPPDGPGTIRLYPHLKRSYEVQDAATGDVLATGDVPWVKAMNLSVETGKSLMHEAHYEFLKSVDVTSAEIATSPFENIERGHSHSAWRLSAVDFDGTVYDGPSVSADYVSELMDVDARVRQKWTDTIDVFRLRGTFTARHAKSLEVRCNVFDGSGRTIAYLDESLPFSENVYDSQIVTEDFVVRNVRAERAECFYVMIGFDGRWVPWNEGRAVPYSK